MAACETIDILSIEDDVQDRVLLTEIFKTSRKKFKLSFVEDGYQAMGYLRKKGEFARVSRPDLIVLDLNLPKLTGHEVMEQIRRDPSLKNIPILVLTGSTAPADKAECERFENNAYLSKPSDIAQFELILDTVETICTRVQNETPTLLEQNKLMEDIELEKENRTVERAMLRKAIEDLERRIAQLLR